MIDLSDKKTIKCKKCKFAMYVPKDYEPPLCCGKVMEVVSNPSQVKTYSEVVQE